MPVSAQPIAMNATATSSIGHRSAPVARRVKTPAIAMTTMSPSGGDNQTAVAHGPGAAIAGQVADVHHDQYRRGHRAADGGVAKDLPLRQPPHDHVCSRTARRSLRFVVCLTRYAVDRQTERIR